MAALDILSIKKIYDIELWYVTVCQILRKFYMGCNVLQCVPEKLHGMHSFPQKKSHGSDALASAHTKTNKEGGRTSFGVPFSDGSHLFGVLFSDGNHCKRTPKFMTLGINLNKRGAVT